MKQILFVLLLLSSTCSFSHDYFFAFAEIEYDEYNARVEATIVMTTHDFESYLRKRNIISKELNTYKNDSIVLNQIETEISQHFTIKSEAVGALAMEAFEIELTGMIKVYLSAPILMPSEGLDIQFDLLMDEYKEQQNKLTFIYRDKKNSYVYLQNKRSQHIDFY